MSYQSQAQLTDDVWFNARSRAATVQQAEIYKDDARPDFVALADSCLLGVGEVYLTFARIAAGAPGIADKVDNGDGTIDQTQVTDDDLLSLTQTNWQVVAALYYDEQGEPIQ